MDWHYPDGTVEKHSRTSNWNQVDPVTNKLLPSVRLVDPITCEPHVSGEVPPPAEEPGGGGETQVAVTLSDKTGVSSTLKNGIGNCIAFNHEPNLSAVDTLGAVEDACHRRRLIRRRKVLDELLGEQSVKFLESIGALENIADKIEASLPAHVMTSDDEESDILAAFDTWVDSDIEITLDSGCCEHVMDLGDAPGYGAFLVESAGSKRKQNFIVGNGARVPNEGQLSLNLESDEGRVKSVFQIAEVTRPLMSVSKVCDQGMRCIFEETFALVVDMKTGKEVLKFERHGGLYVAKMRLKPPEGFVGPVPR